MRSLLVHLLVLLGHYNIRINGLQVTATTKAARTSTLPIELGTTDKSSALIAKHSDGPPTAAASRRQWILASVFATASLGVAPLNAQADESSFPFSNAELQKIVTADILDKQFLATGDITRSIYRPTATFTDEIDTYGLDQWVKGTQRLFVGSKSSVRLVGDVNVSDSEINFRFDEDLMFNIPFRPVVSLTGKVVLARDDAGFITSYQEFWDQDTFSVLKTAKFGQ